MTLIKSISGIRGTIGGLAGENLTPPDLVKFTSAFGIWLLNQNKTETPKVVLGRDARISGEMVNRLVSGTLMSLGIEVIDLGMATTPTVEIAVVAEQATGGIVLSASHNPAQWNALKLLNEKGEFISDEEGKALLKIAEEGNFSYLDVMKIGLYHKKYNYLKTHIAQIVALPLVNVKAIEDRNFTILVDGINSVGGIAVPALLHALGVKNIVEVNCRPTGQFAHNPEPLPEHLVSTALDVVSSKSDLGIVVDPDVDRLAFITEKGLMFGEEYTLVAVADYVLQEQTGNTVSNLSSTSALRDVTLKAGGKYFTSAVGEVNVVAKMKEVNAIIGGEGNGGVIYPALHYGRDALVGIALFLSYLAVSGKTCSSLRDKYPDYHLSKNKIDLRLFDQVNPDEVLNALKQKYERYPITDIDGLRIDFEQGWVHLRKSNTEPIIRIYAESASETIANTMAKHLISQIKEMLSG
ncbi:MAG: phosphoglucosamine mutase [Sphingobacteriales bacterium]|nr:MAG: phosphoglucosamine mutase [Sphingobacteriales bacterium]